MATIAHLGLCLEMAWALFKSKGHVTGKARLHYYLTLASPANKKGIHPKGLFGMIKAAPERQASLVSSCINRRRKQGGSMNRRLCFGRRKIS